MSVMSVETTPAPAAETATKGTTDGENELPSWARESMQAANAEAARRRVEARELKTQRDEALERAAAVDALQRELEETRRASTALRAAVQIGVPLELADRLRGDTEEELLTDAQRIRELFNATPVTETPPTPPPAPTVRAAAGTGGLTPGVDDGVTIDSVINLLRG